METHECDLSDCFITIEYDIENNTCWIKRYFIDPTLSPDSILFGHVLTKALASMKNKNIKTFTQTLFISEWEELKCQSEWNIDRKYDEFIEIYCNIDDAFELIVKGFQKN